MIKSFRFSPSRLALVYIALSVLAIALLAIPLWYAWRVNISTFRAYVQGEDMQRLVEVFHRGGAKALVTAMESEVKSLPADQIMVLADGSKRRLAGNLLSWPAEIPDAPGTYGLVIDRGVRRWSQKSRVWELTSIASEPDTPTEACRGAAVT